MAIELSPANLFPVVMDNARWGSSAIEAAAKTEGVVRVDALDLTADGSFSAIVLWFATDTEAARYTAIAAQHIPNGKVSVGPR